MNQGFKNVMLLSLVRHIFLLYVVQAPVYLREYARMHFIGTKALQTKVSEPSSHYGAFLLLLNFGTIN